MGMWDALGLAGLRDWSHRSRRIVTTNNRTITLYICVSIPRSLLTMSTRISADLQRADRAIRPGVSHRAKLKSGSVEAWNACLSSLQETEHIIEDSSFSDQNSSSAAVWVHWRKSGTSKQLLSLLRTAVEEAPGSAVVAGCVRECALHVGLVVISFLFKCSQSGTLWPAMREWRAVSKPSGKPLH